jgi:hypothetical protein
LLFDLPSRMAQQSTSGWQRPLPPVLVPSVTNQTLWGRARLRDCAPGCGCVCARCAWIRARARHARWGADPT